MWGASVSLRVAHFFSFHSHKAGKGMDLEFHPQGYFPSPFSWLCGPLSHFRCMGEIADIVGERSHLAARVFVFLIFMHCPTLCQPCILLFHFRTLTAAACVVEGKRCCEIFRVFMGTISQCWWLFEFERKTFRMWKFPQYNFILLLFSEEVVAKLFCLILGGSHMWLHTCFRNFFSIECRSIPRARGIILILLIFNTFWPSSSSSICVAWWYFPSDKNTTCVQKFFLYSRFECRELCRCVCCCCVVVYLLDYTFFLVARRRHWCNRQNIIVVFQCYDYNIFSSLANMILICITRMMVLYLVELYFLWKVLQWEGLRDILFSCSITFMCVSYRMLGDIINTL